MKGESGINEAIILDVILIAAVVAVLIAIVVLYLSGQGIKIELPKLV